MSGYQDPAGGHEEGGAANHRERPVSRGTVLRISCRTIIAPAAHVRRPRLDYESHVTGLDCSRAAGSFCLLTRLLAVRRQQGLGRNC
jgi:hypothetical protein